MLKNGDVIKNKYKIQEVLSSGERTNVYLVVDMENHLECVLKEFILPLKNPQMANISAQKFEKEVIILAGLEHPAIPRFYDQFSIVDRQYLVREFVGGKTLDRIIDEASQPFYEPDALKLGIQIADMLHFLHKQIPSIIFKDLRPSHIIITPENSIKVIDFGLARHFTSLKKVKSRKIGIPGYAPPEQFGKDVFDKRTDIYALGAILHQLLTLRNPSELPNIFKFPPVGKINPKVSRIFENIVDKATRHNSTERYYSALEMMREMDTLLKRRGAAEIKRPAPPPPPARIESGPAVVKAVGAKTTPQRNTPPPKRAELPPDFDPYPGYNDITDDLDDLTAPKKPGFNFANLPIKYLAIGVAVLLVIFLGLGIVYFIKTHKKKVVKNTLESPFALVKDKRILQLREDAIKNYEKGIKSGDKGQLSMAITNFRKVITAHPTDAISQIYLENAQILMQGKPYVKVAALLSLTGDNFEAGMQMLAGIALGQAVHNDDSKGNKIFVEIYDNHSRQDECIQLASQISEKKDILAVIGPIRSPYLESTAPFFDDKKMVQLSPSGVCPNKENLGSYIFRTSGDGRNLGSYMAELGINQLNLKKFAVVYDPTQIYSKILGETFMETVKESGKGETKAFLTPLDAKDFEGILREIKEYNPDGVFFVAYQNQEGVFARQMRKMGINAIHLATQATYSQQVINDGGEAAEGIIFNSYFFPAGETESSRNFIKQFDEKYPDIHPNFRAALSFDSLMAIGIAVDNGVSDSTSLMKFLKTKLGSKKFTLQGATGIIEFDKFGRRKKINIVPVTVKNGKFQLYK